MFSTKEKCAKVHLVGVIFLQILTKMDITKYTLGRFSFIKNNQAMSLIQCCKSVKFRRKVPHHEVNCGQKNPSSHSMGSCFYLIIKTSTLLLNTNELIKKVYFLHSREVASNVSHYRTRKISGILGSFLCILNFSGSAMFTFPQGRPILCRRTEFPRWRNLNVKLFSERCAMSRFTYTSGREPVCRESFEII